MSEPVVDIRGLSKRYGDFDAVSNLEMQVPPGELFALLGPNGAGKTTTLRMLAGLIAPSTGQARVCGIDVQQEPLLARKRLGFLTASPTSVSSPQARYAEFGLQTGADATPRTR